MFIKLYKMAKLLFVGCILICSSKFIDHSIAIYEVSLINDKVETWNKFLPNIIKETDYKNKKLMAYNLNEEIHYTRAQIHKQNIELLYSKTKPIKSVLRDILINL